MYKTQNNKFHNMYSIMLVHDLNLQYIFVHSQLLHMILSCNATHLNDTSFVDIIKNKNETKQNKTRWNDNSFALKKLVDFSFVSKFIQGLKVKL
jgi:hypothetical protein